MTTEQTSIEVHNILSFEMCFGRALYDFLNIILSQKWPSPLNIELQHQPLRNHQKKMTK
jgi:hypothetical protein